MQDAIGQAITNVRELCLPTYTEARMTHEKILREGVAAELHADTARYARELADILDSFAHCDTCVDEWAETLERDFTFTNTIHDFITIVQMSREWARD